MPVHCQKQWVSMDSSCWNSQTITGEVKETVPEVWSLFLSNRIDGNGKFWSSQLCRHPMDIVADPQKRPEVWKVGTWVPVVMNWTMTSNQSHSSQGENSVTNSTTGSPSMTWSSSSAGLVRQDGITWSFLYSCLVYNHLISQWFLFFLSLLENNKKTCNCSKA